MSDEITIIIADDHPIVRQGLRQAIERAPGLRILAEADDGVAALALVKTHRPHIVVLDVDMPRLDGFGVAREIQAHQMDTRVIFLTFHGEEDYLNQALELGAAGYLLKDSAISEIVTCLQAVQAGRSYLSPTLTTYLVQRARRPPDASGLAILSPTERHILKLLAEYKTSKEIAAALHISAHTVNTHRANIALKLDLHGSHALMKFALDHKATL